MPNHPHAADRPCVAGILFALPIEADAFERRVVGRREWRSSGPAMFEGAVAGCRVAWCVTGVGGDAATRAARLMLDGHRPAALVAAGFAGGLDPAIARGSVVRPTAVVREPAAGRIGLATAGCGVAGPLLVSVDAPATTPDRKRQLAARTGAAVVDMETYAVAAVAAAAGLPCYGIRVVSDDAGQPLPPEVAALARPQTAARRFGAVLGALGRRPAVALDLWRLYEHAVVDGRELAVAIETLLGELASSPTAALPGAGPADSAAGRARAP
jgi:adenosylhomocysteine nucleosidase